MFEDLFDKARNTMTTDSACEPAAEELTKDTKVRLSQIKDLGCTKDAKYKPGDISQKTGLQKQNDGTWAPPKETKFGIAKQENGQWGVRTKAGRNSEFIQHKNEDDAKKALANYTAGYNTTERSKEDPHSDRSRLHKKWDKDTDKIRKENRAERRAEHASHFKNENKPAEKAPAKSETRNFRDELTKNPKSGYDFSKTIEHSIPMNATSKDELSRMRSFMDEEHSTYKQALLSRAQHLVDGAKGKGDWYPEKEEAVMNIAKAVGYDKELHSFIEEEMGGYDFGYRED